MALTLELELQADATKMTKELKAAGSSVKGLGDDAKEASKGVDEAFKEMAASTKELAKDADRSFGKVAKSADDVSSTRFEAATGAMKDHVLDLAGSAGDAFKNIGQSAETMGVGVASGVAAATAGLTALVGVVVAFSKAFGEALGGSVDTRKLQGSLGTTADLSAQYGKLAGDLYRQNYGESVAGLKEDIAAAVKITGVKDVSGLEPILKDAENIANIFDVDVSESLRGVNALVKSGLVPNFNAAGDVMVSAFQSGLNVADDLVDTLVEYGPHLKAIGLDAQTAMGLFQQGLAAGARDLDSQADSLKEFNIIAREARLEAPAAVESALQGLASANASYQSSVNAVENAMQGVIDAQRSYQDALEAVGDAEQGVIDAQVAYQDALEGVGDAQRGVVAAQRSYQDSLDAVADAERRHADSVHDVEDAQRSLAEAEAELDAARRGRSEADQLSIEGAQIALLRARERAEKAAGDAEASALDRQEATLAVRRADMALRDAQAKAAGRVIEAEKKVADAKGDVVDAQDAEADAAKGVADAHQGVEDAAQGVVDAERGVRDAHREVEGAARGVKDAQDGVRDAHRGVEAASRGIKTAQDGVRDAHNGVASAAQGVQKAEKDLANAREKQWLGALSLKDTLDLLHKTPDPLEQDRIGLAKFGTMWEDNKAAIMSWDPGKPFDPLIANAKDAAGRLDTTFDGSLATLIEKFKRGIGQSLVDSMGKLINWIEGTFIPWWENTGKPFFDELWDDVQKAWDAMSAWWEDTGQPMFDKIVTTLRPIFDFLSEHKDEIKELALVLAAALAAAGIAILIIGGIIGGFVALVVLAFGLTVLNFLKFGRNLWDLAQSIKDWAEGVKKNIEEWVGKIGDFFRGLWSSISDGATNAWNWVKTKFDDLVNFMSGVPGRIGEAVKGMWDSLKTGLLVILKWVAEHWNDTIGSLKITVPDWVPIWGGREWEFPKMPVPELAAGGIVTRPTLALIGEAGPEAVIPLGKMGGATVVNIHVTTSGLGADSAAIQRGVVDALRNWEKRNGALG